MNWEAVSSVAELVGAAAVVVSLVFLIRQIRLNSDLVQQNSRHVEATIYHATNSAFLAWQSMIAQDRELASIWTRFMSNGQLDELEVFRAQLLLRTLFLCYESNFQQVRLGVNHRNSIEFPMFSEMMEREAVRLWWSRVGPKLFTAEFREAVEEIARRNSVKRQAGDTV
jgi:hypothetical protein